MTGGQAVSVFDKNYLGQTEVYLCGGPRREKRKRIEQQTSHKKGYISSVKSKQLTCWT